MFYYTNFELFFLSCNVNFITNYFKRMHISHLLPFRFHPRGGCHMKQTGMLVDSLRDINVLNIWSRLGVPGKVPIILSRKGLV